MKIVVLDGETLNPGDNPWSPVEALGQLQVFDATNPAEVVGRAVDADVVLTNKVVLDRTVIEQLPQLKFIGVTATGYNVVDIECAKERGIPVSNVPVYGTDSVAQHVFACLLAFIHCPERHALAVRDGQWAESGKFSFWLQPIHELAGKTFAVIGWGRIGQATAALAHAFGMKVVAASRRQINPPAWDNFEWLSVDACFAQADVISLHCPLTDQNAEFVNRDLLDQMKPNSILINTARGGLIDELELANALNSDQIAGALLDVVSEEPMPNDHPLRHIKNCLITPHIAWTAIDARRRLMQTTADNVSAFIKGWPINIVA